MDFYENVVKGNELQVFILIILLIVIGYVGHSFYIDYKHTECVVSTGYTKMIYKDFQPSYQTMMWTGEMMVPIYHDEEYNCIFECEEMNRVVDSKFWFNNCEVGDQVLVEIYKFYDIRTGKLRKQTFYLPNENER